jgi:hypothetical protein
MVFDFASPFLLAPALLLVFYLAVRWYVRRDNVEYSTAAQYESPEGFSPAALRYVVRGGVDGSSLAATLAHLSCQGYIEVRKKDNDYAFLRTEKCETAIGMLCDEERAIVQLLFDKAANVADPACGKATAFGDLSTVHTPGQPRIDTKRWAGAVALGPADPRINVLTGMIYTRLKPRLEGKYFTWNTRFVAVGMLAAFLFGMFALAAPGKGFTAVFYVIWSFLFFQMFSAIIGLAMLARKRRPLLLAFVTAVFTGVTVFASHQMVREAPIAAVGAYLVMIVINSIFIPLLRTPTTEGQVLQSRIRGFKEFLEQTEEDRLRALGTRDGLMPRLEALPYAIALDLEEPWGDALADTFAAAVTTVG